MRIYRLSCACGACVMDLRGAPAARAICHCDACRDLYSTIALAATAWPASQVAYGGDAEALRAYRHPARQMRRHVCERCGELVHGTHRFEMIVVPNARVMRAYDGTMPSELAPAMHLFYARRAFDIADDLPKYLEGWDGPLA